ncbi:tRNA lysidine(34) synthetase TilS [Vibrio sp. NH-7]
MDLYQSFSSVIEEYLAPRSRIVLAFSGGIDSRVLLSLLARYQQETHRPTLAVHVHHGLSVNADEWANQCQEWAAQSDVPFILEKVQLDASGKSIEECARDERYKVLARHVNEKDILLTGQHGDDQLETFLLALKRGSGPKGLSAMAASKPFSNGRLVRPLLKVRREEIEQYARHHGLNWVEDESNQDTRFDRNYIRHHISPVIDARWPHFTQSVQRSAQLCAEQELLLDELLQDKLRLLVNSDGSLAIQGVADLSALMRARLIRMWLANSGQRMPSRDHLDKIWHQVALAKADANPVLNLTSTQVRRFNRRLYLVSVHEDISDWSQRLGLGEELELPDRLGHLTLQATSTGSLSLSALQQAPLRIIFNPEGLSAHPAERGHSRKLKKLFQEYQVPSWERRRRPILMCGDKVAAIADLFIDHHFIGQDCELIWSK